MTPEQILNPPQGTFRIVFLYVGQGESTLFIIPDGTDHTYLLMDSNRDMKKNGIDVAKLLKGRIPKNSLIFGNTHPHDDHIRGVEEIHDAVGIKEIWHSGHIPGKKYGEGFDRMKKIMTDVGDENVYYLRGSNEQNVLHTDREETSKKTHKIGDVDFQVFSPAKYVCEEIGDEDPEVRRRRIHEQCGVIKFSYKGASVLITGDADREAWEEHITEYFGEDLKSTALSAVHHGSRTFFYKNETEEDPYEEHIKKISPEFLIVSAPKNSIHGHPHPEAMKIYEKYVSEENIFRLGEKNSSVVMDVNANGEVTITEDQELSKEFGLKDDDEKNCNPPDNKPYEFKPKSKIYCPFSD